MSGIDLRITETIQKMFHGEFESEFALDAAAEQIATRQLIQDVANNGSIMAYLDVSRNKAAASVARLVDVDPTDVGEITSIKSDVRAYVELVSWMSATVGAVTQTDKLDRTEEKGLEPEGPAQEPGGNYGESDFAD